MRACHRCKAPWDEPGQPGFNNTCSRCGMSLHSCMNCVHFVSRGAVRCMVQHDDRIQNPSAGNQCRSFEFANFDEAAAAASTNRVPDVAAFFQRSTAAAPLDPAAARKRWEQLFKS